MGWRTVVITKCSKLDLKLGSMVVRNSTDIQKIHISELSTVIIESTAVSITAALISELVKQKVKIIFCDETRSPQSELVPYYGSHDSSLKVRNQVKWTEFAKQSAWTEIVIQKIRNQYLNLLSLGCVEARLLEGYIDEIEFNDVTNREGHAAKVYFNAMFGKDFSRDQDNAVNAALNYGYSILLSAFNREICSCGYITQLGLFHDNMFNHYNLSCDLMEPFRPYIDAIVVNMQHDAFTKDDKIKLVRFLNKEILIDEKMQTIPNAIKLYCRSVFNSIEKCSTEGTFDSSIIKFAEYEL